MPRSVPLSSRLRHWRKLGPDGQSVTAGSSGLCSSKKKQQSNPGGRVRLTRVKRKQQPQGKHSRRTVSIMKKAAKAAKKKVAKKAVAKKAPAKKAAAKKAPAK